MKHKIVISSMYGNMVEIPINNRIQELEQKIERLKIRIMHTSNRYKRSDLEDELFDLESDLENELYLERIKLMNGEEL